jgi:hypothetical protein
LIRHSSLELIFVCIHALHFFSVTMFAS